MRSIITWIRSKLSHTPSTQQLVTVLLEEQGHLRLRLKLMTEEAANYYRHRNELNTRCTKLERALAQATADKEHLAGKIIELKHGIPFPDYPARGDHDIRQDKRDRRD